MKRIPSLSVLGSVLLLALGSALPAFAQSANGSFEFQFDNTTKSVDFNVKKTGNSAKGEMTFTGVTAFSDQDGDGTGNAGPSGTFTVTLKVDFDCMVLSGNRAAASGLVKQSSIPALVGWRGLLTVEDNGEGKNQPEPDRFTWGLYRQNETGWVPSDAELTFDSGVGLTWFASDAEREDDAGISSVRPDPGDCRNFSLSSYSVNDLLHGNGNIQVKP